MNKAVDLGKIQERLEIARKTEKATGRALARAEEAHAGAKAELASAQQALRDGVKTVQG